MSDLTTDVKVLNIYLEALRSINHEWIGLDMPDLYDLPMLRKILMDYSDATRQTKEARIARRALKAAVYARLGQ